MTSPPAVDPAVPDSLSEDIIEKSDALQFRDLNQPDLHLRYWCRRGYSEKPNPNVLIWVHGIGEHAGRYKELATEVLTRVPSLDGIASYDQRGHGKSQGARGAAPSVTALVDDFVEHASRRMALEFGMDPRIIIGGHSLGALVVAGAAEKADWLQAEECGKIVGVLLSGPAIYPCVVGAVNKALAPMSSVLCMIPGVKRLTKGSGVDPKKLSHDEIEVQKYLDDDLVHDQIGVGLATDSLNYGRNLIRRLKETSNSARILTNGTPLLVIHGELDEVCSVDGSRALVEACGGNSAELVVVPGAFHEIHNERKENGKEDMLNSCAQFLNKVFAGKQEMSGSTGVTEGT